MSKNQQLDLTELNESELLRAVNKILAAPHDFTEAELDELEAINVEMRRRYNPMLRNHAALILLPSVIQKHRDRLYEEEVRDEIRNMLSNNHNQKRRN